MLACTHGADRTDLSTGSLAGAVRLAFRFVSGADHDVSDQRALWDHYQTTAVDSFAEARPRLRFLAEQLRSGETVLNIGVGGGQFEEEAAERGLQVVSIDPGQQSLAAANARLGMTLRSSAAVLEHLPVRDNSVDAVIVSEVLEHLSDHDLQAALTEIVRVLAPGSTLIGTVPRNENLEANLIRCPSCSELFHRWGHRQSFDADRLHALLSKDFEIDYIRSKRFVPWRLRNTKGRVAEAVRAALRMAGRHGANENLVFRAHT